LTDCAAIILSVVPFFWWVVIWIIWIDARSAGPPGHKGKSMNIGIIGSEAAKFTPETEARAKLEIKAIFADYWPSEGDPAPTIVSGHCHLGGIDIWAEEQAHKVEWSTWIFPPAKQQWEGGYKQRNIQIAKYSDIVYVITLKELPDGYRGMRFADCYHCIKRRPEGVPHVKSGACWTAWYAIEKLGKPARWIII